MDSVGVLDSPMILIEDGWAVGWVYSIHSDEDGKYGRWYIHFEKVNGFIDLDLSFQWLDDEGSDIFGANHVALWCFDNKDLILDKARHLGWNRIV